ncbi:uncharacterized protein YkwD [Pseudomonas duriflava]|uniref:Uncharacterized protein YkwD n=1 Tax=Pseudomonas duriflava TaxID=459528 RepID=A0A562QNH3_9PSED|nr:CAP domain-containing protein [Pseudomonas duriflava]TWI57616.1 uncharacterized protein YkwD [Pseudomonas duriflava]
MTMTSAFIRTLRSYLYRTSLALPLAGLLPITAQAADANQLITLINDYRQSAETCNGHRVSPVSPLAPDDRLAQVKAVSGEQFQAALQKSGYLAATAQAIGLSGSSNPTQVMDTIRQHYCGTLLNPAFAEIGVSYTGTTWLIVLARPLLSKDLGDWQQAGQVILREVNAARAAPRSCGNQAFTAAPPLTWNATLAQTALGHSRDMANQNYFSHAGRDGSQVSDRATREGYQWSRIGENIAAGQGTAHKAVAGWLSSPGHCANIMNPHFTEMGAAYHVNEKSDAAIYWTQVFGTPQ